MAETGLGRAFRRFWGETDLFDLEEKFAIIAVRVRVARARQKRATAAGRSRGKAETRRGNSTAHGGDAHRSHRDYLGKLLPFSGRGDAVRVDVSSVDWCGLKRGSCDTGTLVRSRFFLSSGGLQNPSGRDYTLRARKALLFGGPRISAAFLPQKLVRNPTETRQKRGEWGRRRKERREGFAWRTQRAQKRVRRAGDTCRDRCFSRRTK